MIDLGLSVHLCDIKRLFKVHKTFSSLFFFSQPVTLLLWSTLMVAGSCFFKLQKLTVPARAASVSIYLVNTAAFLAPEESDVSFRNGKTVEEKRAKRRVPYIHQVARNIIPNEC